MQLRPEPPAWVAGYVGLPFHERGRDRRGLDCWGLYRLVQAERFGVELPSWTYSAGDSVERDLIASAFETELASERWLQIDAGGAEVGDAILMQCAREWHIGMVVARGRMLHVGRWTDSCVECFERPLWARRVRSVLRVAAPVRVAGRLVPIAGPMIDVILPAGPTVAEMLVAAGIDPQPSLRVYLGQREVARTRWAHVRPRPGRTLRVAVVPAGGGGNKDTLRIIAMIAVVVASIYFPPAAGLTGPTAAFASAAIGIGGALLVNALIPPARPRLDAITGQNDRTSPAITGTRNEARRWTPVPVILGMHRLAPLYAAPIYTEAVGDDQYLRALFMLGHGPLELSDHQIGETPIASFEGVQMEVRQGEISEAPISLYPATVIEEPLSVLLSGGFGSPESRTTDPDADEISVDVSFPTGLAKINTDGSRSLRTVEFQVAVDQPIGPGFTFVMPGPSPESAAEMDAFFAVARRVGVPTTFSKRRMAWGAGFPDAIPPNVGQWVGTNQGVEFTASFNQPPGAPQKNGQGLVTFALDASDACELFVNGTKVVAAYGTHPVLGAGTPDFSVYRGSIYLPAGTSTIKIRLFARHPNQGALSVGWAVGPPGTPFVIAPLDQVMTTDWTLQQFGPTNLWSVSNNRTELFRRSMKFLVPRGQYGVSLTRTTPDNQGDPTILDEAYWTALRTVRNAEPVRQVGLARVAVRIKATDQLNGTLDTFNLKVQSVVPDWNNLSAGVSPYTHPAAAWVTRATSNPASLYRAALQGAGNAKRLADTRLDLAALQAWHDECKVKGWEFNAVLDFAGTRAERLQEIAAAGRASPHYRDGLFSVVRDRPQGVPVQHFTPRNSRGFKWRRAFSDLPHALRVRFINAAKGYQQDELVVLDDGYSIPGPTGTPIDARGLPAPSLPAAQVFEPFELFGVTNARQAWMLARYYLAVARLRGSIYELQTDVEAIVCNRGDLVRVSHFVLDSGHVAARVRAVSTTPGGHQVGISLDEPVSMTDGVDYAVRVRRQDGTAFVLAVQHDPGPTDALTLAQPIWSPQAQVGDLVMFGPVGQDSRELIIKSIDYGEDLAATITFVDYAPAVFEADANPPTSFGAVSAPATAPRYAVPAAVKIESLSSLDGVLDAASIRGERDARVLVSLSMPDSPQALPERIELQYRPRDPAEATLDGTWLPGPRLLPFTRSAAIEAVRRGTIYEVRARSVGKDGTASPWHTVEHHVAGAIAPPLAPASLAIERRPDGQRRVVWTLPEGSVSTTGVMLRYGTAGAHWTTLRPLHDGVLPLVTPVDLVGPPTGTWAVAIKAVDARGRESRDAHVITVTLGSHQPTQLMRVEDPRPQGWPGTKTHCTVDASRHLIGDGTGASLVYEHSTIDLGAVVDIDLAINPDAIGTPTVSVDWSEDGATWQGWTPVSAVLLRSLRARYIKVMVSVDAATPGGTAELHEAALVVRSEVVSQAVLTLATSGLPADYRTGPGDFKVPVARELFSAVSSVQISFVGAAYAGYSAVIVDKAASPGPAVKTYNAAGALADAVIDVVVRGAAVRGDAPKTPLRLPADPDLIT